MTSGRPPVPARQRKDRLALRRQVTGGAAVLVSRRWLTPVGRSQGSEHPMLFRSTGLGKAELVAQVVEINRQGDYLIMEMQTTEPVKWKIRGGLSHQDFRTLLRATFKLSVLRFFLDPSYWFRRPGHPGEF